MANPFPTLSLGVTRKAMPDNATFPSDIKYVRTYDIPGFPPTIPTGKGTALNLTSGVILLMLSDNKLKNRGRKNHNAALHSNSRGVITPLTLGYQFGIRFLLQQYWHSMALATTSALEIACTVEVHCGTQKTLVEQEVVVGT